MRAVFWEAEVDSTERLRPSRPGTTMSTALGGGWKERSMLYPEQCQALAASESPGAHQLLGVKTDGRAADRASETSMQPRSILGCGPLHWDTHLDPSELPGSPLT